MAGVGEASAIIQIVSTGFGIAKELTGFVKNYRQAPEDINELIRNIESTFGLLQELGRLVERHDQKPVWSPTGRKIAQSCIDDGRKINLRLREVIQRDGTDLESDEIDVNNVDFSRLSRLLWFFQKPETVECRLKIQELYSKIGCALSLYRAETEDTQSERERYLETGAGQWEAYKARKRLRKQMEHLSYSRSAASFHHGIPLAAGQRQHSKSPPRQMEDDEHSLGSALVLSETEMSKLVEERIREAFARQEEAKAKEKSLRDHAVQQYQEEALARINAEKERAEKQIAELREEATRLQLLDPKVEQLIECLARPTLDPMDYQVLLTKSSAPPKQPLTAANLAQEHNVQLPITDAASTRSSEFPSTKRSHVKERLKSLSLGQFGFEDLGITDDLHMQLVYLDGVRVSELRGADKRGILRYVSDKTRNGQRHIMKQLSSLPHHLREHVLQHLEKCRQQVEFKDLDVLFVEAVHEPSKASLFGLHPRKKCVGAYCVFTRYNDSSNQGPTWPEGSARSTFGKSNDSLRRVSFKQTPLQSEAGSTVDAGSAAVSNAGVPKNPEDTTSSATLSMGKMMEDGDPIMLPDNKYNHLRTVLASYGLSSDQISRSVDAASAEDGTIKPSTRLDGELKGILSDKSKSSVRFGEAANTGIEEPTSVPPSGIRYYPSVRAKDLSKETLDFYGIKQFVNPINADYVLLPEDTTENEIAIMLERSAGLTANTSNRQQHRRLVQIYEANDSEDSDEYDRRSQANSQYSRARSTRSGHSSVSRSRSGRPEWDTVSYRSRRSSYASPDRESHTFARSGFTADEDGFITRTSERSRSPSRRVYEDEFYEEVPRRSRYQRSRRGSDARTVDSHIMMEAPSYPASEPSSSHQHRASTPYLHAPYTVQERTYERPPPTIINISGRAPRPYEGPPLLMESQPVYGGQTARNRSLVIGQEQPASIQSSRSRRPQSALDHRRHAELRATQASRAATLPDRFETKSRSYRRQSSLRDASEFRPWEEDLEIIRRSRSPSSEDDDVSFTGLATETPMDREKLKQLLADRTTQQIKSDEETNGPFREKHTKTKANKPKTVTVASPENSPSPSRVAGV